MSTTIRPKNEQAVITQRQTTSQTGSSRSRASTHVPHEAPPTYQEATGASDAFNAPRYSPRRSSERHVTPLDLPSSSSGASSRARSVAFNGSIASAASPERNAAQHAMETLRSAWDPTPGIHYYDGAKPITSEGVAFEAYQPNPKQTRGEAVQQRKLEAQWIKNMGSNVPFPANARKILKEQAKYDSEYGGPEKIKGKLSTFGKMTQKVISKGNSRTLAEDLAVYQERYEPTPGIAYYAGGEHRESSGGIAFVAYAPHANQSKKEAIRQRKLESIWVRLMPGEPFPANARDILKDEIANDPDPVSNYDKLP